MHTERLTIRPAVETDRQRFLALFAEERFMEFSGGIKDPDAANERFDRMMRRIDEIPFAKQPIFVTGSDVIVGYCGFDRVEFEGTNWLEMGWRLVPEARGLGYATEAGRALLKLADATTRLTESDRTALAVIDPRNTASANVARKLGFTYWKTGEIQGFVDNLYQRPLGELPG